MKLKSLNAVEVPRVIGWLKSAVAIAPANAQLAPQMNASSSMSVAAAGVLTVTETLHPAKTHLQALPPNLPNCPSHSRHMRRHPFASRFSAVLCFVRFEEKSE
jgi:hypothetical protein